MSGRVRNGFRSAWVAVTMLCIVPVGWTATIKLGGSQTGTSGGPFLATVQSGNIGIYAAGQSFNTFCIEMGEHFSPGNTYYAMESERARFGTNGNGGSDSLGTYDLLNHQTAWLYSQYMSGGLAALGIGWTGSIADLIALQNAIWAFEGESSGSSAMKAALMVQANANAQVGNLYNVRVMQLWTSESAVNTHAGRVQDQLVLVPTPGPAAAAFGLLGAIGLFAWYKRRPSESV
jgi:hypothetical protein